MANTSGPSQESDSPYSPPPDSGFPIPDSDSPSDLRSPSPHLRSWSEDWIAVLVGGALLALALGAVLWARGEAGWGTAGGPSTELVQPLKAWLDKPGGWEESPLEAFERGDRWRVPGIVGVLLLLWGAFALVVGALGISTVRFAGAFPVVFALALLAYLMEGQAVMAAYDLGYALWALVLGLLISNTAGVPGWVSPAVRTELYIKTGLVLLGAEVLLDRLLALGLPGVFVAWTVTPIVLISTYWFGQRVLKIRSRSLNMVISADMSVCGVSSAIATAAACRAKKEELSLAVSMSMLFTVVMMIVMPAVIRGVGMDEVIGGAWIGGTIDSTGAVAAAGAALGETAEKTAATVKMIQNILIGATAFGVAVYWTLRVDRTEGTRPDVREIWRRFPKFVLGFLAASVALTCLRVLFDHGPALVEAVVTDATKTLRGWLFCLAFVCIGLETNFRQLTPQLRGGKPLLLYLVGQSFNLVLTLLMAWLMFGVLFRSWVEHHWLP